MSTSIQQGFVGRARMALAGLATAALLTACGGGGGGDATTAVIDAKVVTGFAGNFDWESVGDGGPGAGADGGGGAGAGGALGQFRNAMVVVYLPDGTELGRAPTDPVFGMVTVRPGADYTGPLLIEVRGQAGAYYFEEGTEQYVPFLEGQVLRAFVPRVNKNIGITPFSDAAYRLALRCRDGSGPTEVCGASLGASNGSFPSVAAIEAANTAVASNLNARLPGNLQVDDVTRLPYIVGDATSQDAIGLNKRGVYGLVNAAFSKQAAMYNDAAQTPTLLAVEQLGADMADGRLDGTHAGATTVPAAQRTYDVASLGTELGSAIAQQTTRYGQADARSALPPIVSFANTRYDSYYFDATVRPGGSTATIAMATDTTPTRYPGEVKTYVSGSTSAGGFMVYGNMGSGALFIKQDAAGSNTKILAIGDNTNGELGTGDRIAAPGGSREITLPGRLTHAAGGFGHTVVRLSDGRVFTWGDNAYGQLGQGVNGTALARSLTPVQVNLPAGAVAVAATNVASFALLEDGSVYSWGSAWDFGSLGDGTDNGVRLTPGPVMTAGGPLSGVVQISAADNDAVALKSDGTVWQWGSFPPPATTGAPFGSVGGTPSATQVTGFPTDGRVRQVMTEQGITVAVIDGGSQDGAVYTWGVYFDLTAQGVLYDMAPTRVLNLPPVRDLMRGGFLGYGARPTDRMTAMGIDYDGGMWKIRGRVAEIYDPNDPTRLRRPLNQSPRPDCSSCHTVRTRTLPPMPTTGSTCVLPASHFDNVSGDPLLNSASICAGCHNGNPIANGTLIGALSCTMPSLPAPAVRPAATPLTTQCTIPPNHPSMPAGGTCATCHNSVIAAPLTCADKLPTLTPSTTSATITKATDDFGAQQGDLADGATTDDPTPTFTGTLSAPLLGLETVVVTANNQTLGTATASGTSWTFTAPPQTDSNGTQRIDFRAHVAGAGGNGPVSGPFGLSFALTDTTPPTATPTLEVSADSPVSGVPRMTGVIPHQYGMTDNTPTIKVTVNANLPTDERRVQLYQDVTPIGSPVTLQNVGVNQWQATIVHSTGLNVGGTKGFGSNTFRYNARVLDDSGNRGPASASYDIVVGLFNCEVLRVAYGLARGSSHSSSGGNCAGCHAPTQVVGGATRLPMPPPPTGSSVGAYYCTTSTVESVPLKP